MFSYYTYHNAKTKALISLRRRAGWSAPLLFACNRIRFSRDETYKFISYHQDKHVFKTLFSIVIVHVFSTMALIFGKGNVMFFVILNGMYFIFDLHLWS